MTAGDVGQWASYHAAAAVTHCWQCSLQSGQTRAERRPQPAAGSPAHAGSHGDPGPRGLARRPGRRRSQVPGGRPVRRGTTEERTGPGVPAGAAVHWDAVPSAGTEAAWLTGHREIQRPARHGVQPTCQLLLPHPQSLHSQHHYRQSVKRE